MLYVSCMVQQRFANETPVFPETHRFTCAKNSTIYRRPRESADKACSRRSVILACARRGTSSVSRIKTVPACTIVQALRDAKLLNVVASTSESYPSLSVARAVDKHNQSSLHALAGFR